ncbi:hypothetical protein BH23ACT2_BH23ACT2_28310 [soil metagenome]
MPKRAAIYARISKDDGTGLGVKRQEADCRALAERRGWEVAEVVIDNDSSAYGAKARKGYSKVIAGIEAGTFDALIVWHPDRLHRSPVELENFIHVVERTGVAVANVTSGDVDLSTPEGRLTARIIGSVARKESEDKSRRLRRKHVELAEAGKISGGGRRPFGFEADKLTIREAEAAEIRQAVARVLAGASLRSVALDWNAREVATVTGAAWRPTTVKRLLCSPRIAGLRGHQGKIVGPAVWPGIIDPDDGAKVRSILTARPAMRSARAHLLTGYVYCGRCDVPMTAAPVKRKGHRYARYACPLDRGGCGRCGIAGGSLDAQVTADLLHVLDTQALTDAVAAQPEPGQADPVDVTAQIEARMATLAEMFAAGEIGRAEWTTARDALDRRLADTRTEAATDARDHGAAALVAGEADLRGAWERWTLEQRRAVIGTVVDRIVIAPTTQRTNRFDVDRIAIEWKA